LEREIADVHEFKEAYPEVAGKLKLGVDLTSGDYVYRLGKQRRNMFPTHIMRLPLAIYKARGGRFYPERKGYYDADAHRTNFTKRSARGNMKLTELEAA
jgi:hypothetical protein